MDSVVFVSVTSDWSSVNLLPFLYLIYFLLDKTAFRFDEGILEKYIEIFKNKKNRGCNFNKYKWQISQNNFWNLNFRPN